MVIARHVVFLQLAGLEVSSGDSLPGLTLGGSESLTIELESGSAIMYGATTDNRTQDPTLQYARLLPVE